MYDTHSHKLPNGRTRTHTHPIEEWESEGHDHEWSVPAPIVHPFAAATPLHGAGSYALMLESHLAQARRLSLESLRDIMATRSQNAFSEDACKRAAWTALVMAEGEGA